MADKSSTYLVCLNEIDFDLVRHYCSLGKLKHFSSLLDKGFFYRTQSESEYQLLEPWIQWVTVHTGLTYSEHGVFRLGDIVDRKDLSQLWEILESKGKSVGAISPFNADNRLDDPAFFVPDPWTQTTASGSWLLKRLSRTVSLAVNENAAGRIGLSDAMTLVASILTYSPFLQYPHYLSLLLKIGKPGSKAMLLDLLLGHVFISLCKKHQPDFASLFLNSGAHIQHHYLFNSTGYKGANRNPDWYCDANSDPVADVLSIYDGLIGQISESGNRLIVATGLHQVPHQENTYYWRIKDHRNFMATIGIANLKALVPKMSRDFLLEFHTVEECENAAQILKSVRISGHSDDVFSVDNRGLSLFVELVYAKAITSEDSMTVESSDVVVANMREHVAFVAIKNGEHNGEGYVLTNFSLNKEEVFPLRDLRDTIVQSVA